MRIRVASIAVRIYQRIRGKRGKPTPYKIANRDGMRIGEPGNVTGQAFAKRSSNADRLERIQPTARRQYWTCKVPRFICCLHLHRVLPEYRLDRGSGDVVRVSDCFAARAVAKANWPHPRPSGP